MFDSLSPTPSDDSTDSALKWYTITINCVGLLANALLLYGLHRRPVTLIPF